MTLEAKLNSMASAPQSNSVGELISNASTNPLDSRGHFARSMAQITGNPSSSSQGRVSRSIELNEQLNKQIQMALAVKLTEWSTSYEGTCSPQRANIEVGERGREANLTVTRRDIR